MNTLDCYKVDLKGISAGETTSFHWHVEDDFFTAVQGTEITRGSLDVDLEVRQRAEAYELSFHIEGEVAVLCDRCLEFMDIPIDADILLKAKFGDEYDDDGEMVTVPQDEGVINVAWHIYEIAALEIPIRHVHPDGECANASEDGLWEAAEEQEEQKIDPRWAELRKILDNNNK